MYITYTGTSGSQLLFQFASFGWSIIRINQVNAPVSLLRGRRGGGGGGSGIVL